jgi:hypothetical protein
MQLLKQSKMYFSSKTIKRDKLNLYLDNMNNNSKIHFLRAIILLDSIYINKKIELIPTFQELADVGYAGKYHNKLNKISTILLLTQSRDIYILEYLGLKEIENNLT